MYASITLNTHHHHCSDEFQAWKEGVKDTLSILDKAYISHATQSKISGDTLTTFYYNEID